MAEKKGLRQWLWEHRNAARAAYLLHLGSRIFSSLMGILWIRLLVDAMGVPLNGLYVALQTIFSLGDLGDLGVGVAAGIRTGQYLGEGKSKEPELLKFLASARSVFLLFAAIVGGGMLLLSPWLAGWISLPTAEDAGPLGPVFAAGALLVVGILLFSYLGNLNYACGNVTWPVLPDLVLLQFSLLGHWLLARQHQPLWIQFMPYVGAAGARLCLAFFYVRASHPPLARLLPLAFDWRIALPLFESSFWTYICMLGNKVFRSTDALVITFGFALGTLVPYQCNYKFCDLALFLVFTASFVALPKITQWMVSNEPADRERVRLEMRRLNQFQTLLGCGAALAYLAGNDIFMKIWWYHRNNMVAPAALFLQVAFALNLAVTASGDAGLQLALRSGKPGLRWAGTFVAITGVLNLGLSILAMKMGSLWGIAMATVVAQSVDSLGCSFYICRFLKMPWWPWVLRGWLFPLLGIALAGWLRMMWPMDSILHATLLIGAYAVMFLAAAWGLGVDAGFIKGELKLVQKFIGR